MKPLRTQLAIFGLALVVTSCRPERPTTSPYSFAHRIAESDKEFDVEQFRSFRKDGQLTDAVTLGDMKEQSDSRFSLVPPVPSRLRFPVTVPPGGQLDFEVGVAILGAAKVLPAPVTFGIEVDGRRVYEQTVRRRFGEKWFPGTVDLSDRAGAEVEITFATRLSKTPFVDGVDAVSDGLTILPAWGNPVLSGSHARFERPHLILVSIDCLRADHVGAYGHDPPTTPNIDALAADGVVFENTVSVSTWTLPTHMSMLTGMMPTEHGLSRSQKRDPSVPYLPEILSREGYETIGVVSGLYLSPTFGFHEGFDVYRGLMDEPAETIVDAATELVLSEPQRPRFLFMHFFDAHWPYLPEDEYLELAGGRPPDISDLIKNVIVARAPKNEKEIEGTKTLYDAEVAYVDHHLGRFFDELKRHDIYDNALIVLTADHGEGFYEHELWQHSEVIYNEVTRIPLIVKAPGKAPTRRVSRLVSQLGIFPTFLNAIERETPFEHSGLLALASGQASFPERVMTEITWEPTEGRGAFVKLAVTQENLKYVGTFAGDLGDDEFVSRLVEEELYDLARDPDELDNLLPTHVDRSAELRAHARSYIEVVQKLRSRRGGERITLDEELAERLRALGYVQ